MHTDTKLLERLRVKLSFKINQRLISTSIERYPSITYRFLQDGNWKASDLRFTARQDEAVEWINNFWSLTEPNTWKTYGDMFEDELENEIGALINLIKDRYEVLVEKWNKKLEQEFEAKFDDRLLDFLGGKEQGS